MTPNGDPGSDGLPFSWLEKRLDSIEKRMTEHNGAMRAEMSANFAELRRTMADHSREDHEVESRVTVIETERKLEKQAETRRGAIAGSVAGALAVTLVEALKRVFK